MRLGAVANLPRERGPGGNAHQREEDEQGNEEGGEEGGRTALEGAGGYRGGHCSAVAGAGGV